jgi:hypothetical protein|tara:strand:+ start:1298 stop:1444 length:147 start_codon:yes stop_codon:yes gene_type:complete
MGKGSSRRPTDDTKFVENYLRIFNNKKEKHGQNKSDSKNAGKVKKREL